MNFPVNWASRGIKLHCGKNQGAVVCELLRSAVYIKSILVGGEVPKLVEGW